MFPYSSFEIRVEKLVFLCYSIAYKGVIFPFIYSHFRHTVLIGPASSANAFPATAITSRCTPPHLRPTVTSNASLQPSPTISIGLAHAWIPALSLP